MIRSLAVLLFVVAGCSGTLLDVFDSENQPATSPLWNGVYKMKFAGRKDNQCRWVLDVAFGNKNKPLKVAFHSKGKRPEAGSITLRRVGDESVERPDLSASTPAYVDYKWSVTSASSAFNTGFGAKSSGRFEFIIEGAGACRDHGPIFIEFRSTQ